MSERPPFDRLVTAHGLSVLRVCRSLLNVHDADDAWSETFLAALRAYPDLPDDANHEAWLVTIAHRKCVDQVRRTRRLVPTDTTQEFAHFPSELGSPEGALDDEIWKLVQALPPRQRVVIGYRYLGGLDHASIADIIGCTPAASRRAASDGLKALRHRALERALDGATAHTPPGAFHEPLPTGEED